MRYALLFGLAVLVLTMVAVATFDHISTTSLAIAPSLPPVAPPADTVATIGVPTPVAPTVADYARYAKADREWRAAHARVYTIAELRARGDGKRTPREAMQDRVFTYVRRGDRERAVAELQRWLRTHPKDQGSLLSLARLLGETGRSDEAIRRYRQLLALQQDQD